MNFKDWKKIEEDEKTCTLEHPKGHTMVIAISALPKIQREQLKNLEMAHGGRVDSGPSDKEKKELREERRESEGRPTGTNERHSVWKDKSDRSIDAVKDARGSTAIAREDRKEAVRELRNSSRPLKGLKDGGDPAEAPDMPMDDAPQAGPPDSQRMAPMNHAPITIINAPAAPQPAPAPAAPPPAPAPRADGLQETGVQIPKPMAVQSNLLSNGTMNPAAINKNTERVGQAQADIDTAQSQANVKNETQLTKGLQDKAQEYQDTFDEVKKHTDEFAQHFREAGDKVDPRHFAESMSTSQKVAGAIGLFLGGLGTPFGGHNYAMDFLNKQIDRDIDAQKFKSGQEKTIYDAYQQLYSDENVSTNLAKATMYDIYTHNILNTAGQIGGANAAKNAQEWINATVPLRNELLQKAAVQITDLPGGEKAGANGAGTEGAKPGEEGKKTDGVYRILKPESDALFRSFQYKPKLKEYAPELQKQMQMAQQVEKVINGPKLDGNGGLHELMSNMSESAKSGGAFAHVRRSAKDAAAAVPVVGKGAAAALDIVPSTKSERDYNRSLGNFAQDIATATNNLISFDDVAKIIKDNAPQYTESPEEVAKNEKNIINLILKKLPTNYLDMAGMRIK